MMATYYHGGSEIQTDNLQTLYLMNPNYGGYSVSDSHQDQPSGSNMILLNPANNHALNSTSLSHAPPQTVQSQHFVGIPLTNSDDPTLHGLVPRVHYNLWSSLDPATANQSQPHIPTAVAITGPELVNFRRPQQGLSLTLSPQQNTASRQQGGPVTVVSPTSGESPTSVSAASNGVGVQSVILGSKYLKAAQLLLDEVVSVGKTGTKADSGIDGGLREKSKPGRELTGEGSSGGGGRGESSGKRSAELSTAQRQELQMKKAKLLNMLDEVEQRYRQYHNQMQIVVSSFEQAAGVGSARSYTSLALRTISKQFRCLKDAITAQIKATGRSLGEEEAAGVKGESSGLRFVDHQLRQQRALQQLGMMQHNAWRPQRGLPERAVSVLRAWLFEHFLHPYPKDSDKHMLAKQTGLTRSQVSNWFINARVRLWKPMVEEMYMEEMKANELNVSEDTSSKSDHHHHHHHHHNTTNKDLASSSRSTAPPPEDGVLRMEQSPKAFQLPQIEKSSDHNPQINDLSNLSTMSSAGVNLQLPPRAFSLMDLDSIVQRSPTKKQRSTAEMQNSPSSILSMEMEMKPGGETDKDLGHKYGAERHLLMNHGFGAYQIGEMGRFNPDHIGQRYHHGNGVSLTLGLPDCESLSLSGTHHQQNFMSGPNINIPFGRRLEMGTGEPDFCGIGTAQPAHSGAGFESIELQNRKRFAAQLLPDFVA